MGKITNKEIADQFKLLGELMELHGENKFKVRSYLSAYQKLRKLDAPLADFEREELLDLEGVGKAIADKIYRLSHEGTFPQLEEYVDKTPVGVIDLLSIRGLGPKKIRQFWQELNIESPGELLYACKENRLVPLKGMGQKTQDKIEAQLEFHLQSAEWIRIDQASATAQNLLERWPGRGRKVITGDLRRNMPVMKAVDILAENEPEIMKANAWEDLSDKIEETEEGITFRFEGVLFRIIFSSDENWSQQLLLSTKGELLDSTTSANTEEEFFTQKGWPIIPPELRDHPNIEQWLSKYHPDDLVERKDIQGMVHLHTDWSDGGASLEDMVQAAKDRGFSYITITDHSAAAFYANGLSAERLRHQRQAIDDLEIEGIRVFAGCEVDIMPSGIMDLDDDILSELDIVIASVHSQLRMDEKKATERLLRAIAHPHVHMLGHPTGRLILSRPGYPIDHRQIIDACAEHQVTIEINANPLRLDLDWKWIPYAMQQGVMISINPDAHSKSNMDLLEYGLRVARKGGLVKSMCINALDADGFYQHLHRKDNV